jgi:hypothetical protein
LPRDPVDGTRFSGKERKAMKVMSRFAGRALIEEPSASDQRVKLFKELARLGRSDLADTTEGQGVFRPLKESGRKYRSGGDSKA